jgi:hypothetical protein
MNADLRSSIRVGLEALLLVLVFLLLVAGSAWMTIDGEGANRIVGIVGLLFFGGGGLVILLLHVHIPGVVSTQGTWRVVDRATSRVLMTTRESKPYAAVETLLEEGWTWDGLEVSHASISGGFHCVIPDYGSLNIARTAAFAMVVAETVEHSDTIFTCPASMIRCPEARLQGLVAELEASCWGSGDDFSPMVWFVPYETARDVLELEAHKLNIDGIWINPIVAAYRVDWPDAVRQVLTGQREHLPPAEGS